MQFAVVGKLQSLLYLYFTKSAHSNPKKADAMQAMMKMKKIIIKDIQDTYDRA